jgi:nitrate/TMAO reductase-like tetraheme cytochrome c subunit
LIWAALLVLLALGTAAGCGVVRGERPAHERIDLPSVASCAPCHLQVYEEWEASLHHRAWINDNVRTATADFTQTECRPCHSPMPVLSTGLDAPPAVRDFNHRDGVHCLSCHGRPDGVAALRTVPDAPCRPRQDERLSSARMCWPCHEPTHHAFQEYEQSAAFRDGVRCADCHMPARADGSGHSHGANGGLNPKFVAKAVAWSCRIEAGAVLVELHNRTGHRFPGEIPSRSFVVRVDLPGIEPLSELLRKPNKGEARADNRLQPDERRVLRFPLPDGADPGAVRVSLLWLPLPLLPREQAFVLGEWPAPAPSGGGR